MVLEEDSPSCLEKPLFHLPLQELPERNDLHRKKMHVLSMPKPHYSSITYNHRRGCLVGGYPLKRLRGHRLPRCARWTQPLVCLELGRPQMALCHHTTPARTGSCPVPPWPTPALGGSQARYARVEGGVHSLLCEILIAGFWVATAAPGLLSLVSCMRSLMMACLSTEPAGTPGRLSGKSCGNWLFCRSSRISSKLSNSLPGCNKEHANPQYTSLLARC